MYETTDELCALVNVQYHPHPFFFSAKGKALAA
jgi:hypothetical protein